VALTLGEIHASATAGADGKWRADLDLSKAADGPFTLGVEGKNRLALPADYAPSSLLPKRVPLVRNVPEGDDFPLSTEKATW